MFIPREGELLVEKDEPRVLLVCDGRARLAVDANEVGEIGPGDILVLTGPCRQIYRSCHKGPPTSLHLFRLVLDRSQFTFDPATGWPLPLGGEHEETDFTVFLQNRCSRFRHLVRAQTPAMRELLESIRQDAESETPGFRHRINARARLLITFVGEALAQPGQAGPGGVAPTRRRWLSERVKEYLLTHAGEPVKLEEVARHLRLSAEHTARVFKKETASTIFDFLREVRIDHAKTLLVSAHLSIHEIARAAGYSSTTLFCRNFKRLVGTTPSAYRERGGGRRSYSGSVVRTARPVA